MHTLFGTVQDAKLKVPVTVLKIAFKPWQVHCVTLFTVMYSKQFLLLVTE